MFHGNLHIEMQSKIEEIYAFTRIYSTLLSVCATITIKMATILTDKFS